jgi:hypothetical protein
MAFVAAHSPLSILVTPLGISGFPDTCIPHSDTEAAWHFQCSNAFSRKTSFSTRANPPRGRDAKSRVRLEPDSRTTEGGWAVVPRELWVSSQGDHYARDERSVCRHLRGAWLPPVRDPSGDSAVHSRDPGRHTGPAPTTNTDGSPLTDLASSSAPCPGSPSVQVASPTSRPGPNQTVSARLTGLTTGTLYNVAVSAVDATGAQSDCSSIASPPLHGPISP